MHESLSSSSEKAGLPPGSFVHVGEVLEAESSISVINYSKLHIEEHIIQSIDEILLYKENDAVTWVNVEGLKNIELIESIGQNFNIHPLVLEDILNTHQRPKFEDHGDYLVIILKGLLLEDDQFSVHYEQISMLVLNNFVFTFKEKSDDLFAPLKQRIKNSKGHYSPLGAGYLTYEVLDTIVDHYFALQDSLDEIVESIEEELLSTPTTQTLAVIQKTKRELIFVRRSVSPLRELLASIDRSESPLIQEKTKIYFRDVYDHVIRITEMIELYRDLISGMLDIYLSSSSNKMNETMKILTVFASIFIPLTFITGVYGMNFEYMPELKLKWTYPVLWGSFFVIPILLLLLFKIKKWL